MGVREHGQCRINENVLTFKMTQIVQSDLIFYQQLCNLFFLIFPLLYLLGLWLSIS